MATLPSDLPPVPSEAGKSFHATQWDWPMQHQDGVVQVRNDKQRFQVGLQVQYFTPKEISVKVVGRELVVHCKHDERVDEHGRITREIFRSYRLPGDIDPGNIKSHLTGSGILVVSADKS